MTPPAFRATVTEGVPTRLRLEEDGGRGRDYRLPDRSHAAFLDLLAAMAADFDLRLPLARRPPDPDEIRPASTGGLCPVLTEPVAPRILYGYGDPCVVKVADGDYRLLVTSNDAPDAFPILTSPDLESWRLTGFVFPEGSAPPWALTGSEVSDFWAPELHRLGEAWVVCFCARMADRQLAIGLARAASPDGPFTPDPSPLLDGGVIDPHIVVEPDGTAWLIWKQDDNGRWPPALMGLLRGQPALAAKLFSGPAARSAAALTALWSWGAGLEPMQQFFLLQPLIEAAGEDLERFADRLRAAAVDMDPAAQAEAGAILTALKTRIFAQRLSADGRALEGDPVVILQNDLPWEGHLVEGVWIARANGRYCLFYAGNDFSTPRYAIGLAVAPRPTGPFIKRAGPVVRSTSQWWGPGHPSVARAPDGELRMFLHGFRPGKVGYKAFRALLTTPLGPLEVDLAATG